MSDIKPIAFYLPQFHPIPENDEWWGKGFTEWTNVAKAKPLFKGHRQPFLPSDLGFYDLRVPETREQQAALAREYGIHAFCYWHYWFGGRRILEKPFVDVVRFKSPDFPFCLAWANQTWSGTWHGLSSKKVLIEQTYPGIEDYTAHFYALLEAFFDKRYIEIDGKKLFLIFRPSEIPDTRAFFDCWQNLALKEGLTGFHFLGMHMPHDWDYEAKGFNGMVEFGLPYHQLHENYGPFGGIYNRLTGKDLRTTLNKIRKLPERYSYRKYIDLYPDQPLQESNYPVIFSAWDNTPRSGTDGFILEGANPLLFYELCVKTMKLAVQKPADRQLLFIKSWNEWAEGNVLEPSRQFGNEFLEVFKKALDLYK